MTCSSIRTLVRGLLFARPPVLSYAQNEAAIGRLPATPIPRVLHQIWLGPARPPLETMASCRQSHREWQYVLWTEDNLPPMLNRAVFDACGAAYHAKADVLRYELLFRFGGVYVDADQLCLRGFDDLLGSHDSFFAGYQNFGNPDLDDERKATTLIANAVVGASPRHPILERVIDDIRDTPALAGDAHGQAWRRVGPAALTKAIEDVPSRAVIHPFHEFYPYHFTENIPGKPEGMLKASHYGSHSVSLWGTTLGRYRRLRRLPGLPAGHLSRQSGVPADFAARHPKLKPVVYHG
jgi:hypothetical protein